MILRLQTPCVKPILAARSKTLPIRAYPAPANQYCASFVISSPWIVWAHSHATLIHFPGSICKDVFAWEENLEGIAIFTETEKESFWRCGYRNGRELDPDGRFGLRSTRRHEPLSGRTGWR